MLALAKFYSLSFFKPLSSMMMLPSLKVTVTFYAVYTIIRCGQAALT